MPDINKIKRISVNYSLIQDKDKMTLELIMMLEKARTGKSKHVAAAGASCLVKGITIEK